MLNTLIILALLAGCSQTDFGGVTTGSRIYDAKFAADHGLTQAQTAACEAEGREIWKKNSTSDFANLKAGQALKKKRSNHKWINIFSQTDTESQCWQKADW